MAFQLVRISINEVFINLLLRRIHKWLLQLLVALLT